MSKATRRTFLPQCLFHRLGPYFQTELLKLDRTCALLPLDPRVFPTRISLYVSLRV